jgi:hypothetical protein
MTTLINKYHKMKKIILFVGSFILSIHTYAQINLEHTYDSAGYYFSTTIIQQLYVVNMEVEGKKYVFVDRSHKLVRFFNLDHSAWKTISFASATDLNPSGDYMSIMYISQHLFNTDDNIEFLYVDQNYPNAVTQVINENGSIMFTANGEAPLCYANHPQVQLPIYNTTSGTKMILSVYNGSANVYNLGGTLNNDIINNPNFGIENLNVSFPYPNPSASSTRIDFKLPKGINMGELVFYDANGKEVKRFKVNDSFESLLLSTEDLQSGIYYYDLQTSIGNSGTKKLVTIK